MKNLAIGILASSLFFSISLFSTTAQAEKLIVATEGAYAPFNYVDSNNQLQGFDVEIAKALCEEMKVECALIAQEWDGMIPGLLAKKYDIIVASMGPTPEREEVVSFSKSYYSTNTGILVRKNSDIKGVTPEDLTGKTLGVQVNTTQAILAEDEYKTKGVDTRFYQTTDEYFSDLSNGRIESVMGDSVQLLDWLQHKSNDCCKLLGTIEGTNDPTVIVMRKDSGNLLERINSAIDGIREKGIYQKISNKFFGRDIY